ncbi:DinB family protein [bacterium]|nr:DinB family protein [bacterium]
MLTAIQQMYDFDAWAMGRLLSDLRLLKPEEYAGVEASGHGTIRDTMAHLLSVQWCWFSWFSGSQKPEEAMQLRIAPEQVSTLEQAASRWVAVREQTERTIKGLSQEAVVVEWPINVPGVTVSALPLWKLLLHVANHGTHTRAQLIAAIRRCGHAPQGEDLIHLLLGR